MASILDVVNGISQALHAKHHGGAEIGLKRESEDLVQGVSIYDPRVMDGFGVQFQGNLLIVKYHSEMPLVDVHDRDFETDIRQTMKDITKFMKTEYRKVTKKTLELVEHGDINIMVQSANRRTAYVNATQAYQIQNVDGFGKEETKPQQDFTDIAKRWLMNIRQPKTYLKENKTNLNTIIEQYQQEMVEEGMAANLSAAILTMALATAAKANPELTNQASSAAAATPNAKELVVKDPQAAKKMKELSDMLAKLSVSDITKQPINFAGKLKGAK